MVKKTSDRLAIRRTRMAADRTFLSYIRTALTMVAIGATFVNFLSTPLLKIFGWVLIPASLVILIYGFIIWTKIRNMDKFFGSLNTVSEE